MPEALFRIVKPSLVRATSANQSAPSNGVGDKAEQLAGKAMKLIPGEIIGLHASITSLWVGRNMWPNPKQDILAVVILEWVMPIILLGTTFYIRARGSQRNGAGWKDTQWPVALFATGSYIGWVLCSGNPVFGLTPDPRIGGSILLLLGALPAVVYDGVKQ